MNNRYNFFKLVVVVFNIEYLLFLGITPYALYRGVWWKYLVIAVVMLLVFMRWVSFVRNNENLWAFIITLIVSLPFNIKFSYVVSIEYFEYMNLFSRVLSGIVFCMSLLSIEEILIGLLTRIIWRRQNDVICIEEED